jgi:hypothetical protein
MLFVSHDRHFLARALQPRARALGPEGPRHVYGGGYTRVRRGHARHRAPAPAGHLAQLRAILDDPEASDNDRFVALELLKNANIAAGGCCRCARTPAPPS